MADLGSQRRPPPPSLKALLCYSLTQSSNTEQEAGAPIDEARAPIDDTGAPIDEAGTPIVVVCPSSGEWPVAAAKSLETHGFCVLTSTSHQPLVPHAVCSACRDAVESRLEDLLGRVGRRGYERDDEFRFAEIVHREGRRYDMPLDWSAGGAGSVGARRLAAAAFTGDEQAAFDALHGRLDVIARAAMGAVVARAAGETREAKGGGEGVRSSSSGQLLEGTSEAEPPMAGCVISAPGASAQAWHSDGSAYGLFNLFVPLVPLTALNGPTEIRPSTHRNAGSTSGFVAQRTAPLLGMGDVLIFDYRCRHRGLANGGEETRPVAYVTYAIGGAQDKHNFPDASTLAFD